MSNFLSRACKVVPSSDPTIIGLYDDIGGHAATVFGFPAEVAMQRANLFAAAPELLEALEGLVGLSNDGAKFSQRIDAAKAAIAKARGEDRALERSVG